MGTKCVLAFSSICIKLVCVCVQVCASALVCVSPTFDNYRATARGFVQLHSGHSVQHNRDRQSGPFSRRSEGLHSCMALRITHTQTYTIYKHTYTQIYRCYLKIRYVWTQFYPNSRNIHTHAETRSAGFSCIHIHLDVNTHETGDTGDSINRKKHTCTDTHTFPEALKCSPYLFCLQCG